MDLALNNLQRLICHKTNQTKPSTTFLKIFFNIFLTISAEFENLLAFTYDSQISHGAKAKI